MNPELETSSYLALVIWGLANTIICISLLSALNSRLADLTTIAKLGLGIILAGSFTRAYGFWTGVKEAVNVWDLMVVIGMAGMSARLALRGVRNLARHEKGAESA